MQAPAAWIEAGRPHESVNVGDEAAQGRDVEESVNRCYRSMGPLLHCRGGAGWLSSSRSCSRAAAAAFELLLPQSSRCRSLRSAAAAFKPPPPPPPPKARSGDLKAGSGEEGHGAAVVKPPPVPSSCRWGGRAAELGRNRAMKAELREPAASEGGQRGGRPATHCRRRPPLGPPRRPAPSPPFDPPLAPPPFGLPRHPASSPPLKPPSAPLSLEPGGPTVCTTPSPDAVASARPASSAAASAAAQNSPDPLRISSLQQPCLGEFAVRPSSPQLATAPWSNRRGAAAAQKGIGRGQRKEESMEKKPHGRAELAAERKE
uniref:Uncharacterized protein n=1 Tax=Oryza glumipatula TaxID=40148 RepID=A0A0D9ZVQ9_9ORYZ